MSKVIVGTTVQDCRNYIQENQLDPHSCQTCIVKYPNSLRGIHEDFKNILFTPEADKLYRWFKELEQLQSINIGNYLAREI